jgi:transposase
VEILHNGSRVASHPRSRGRGKAVTIGAHRPKSHQAHLEWPPSRMVQWAQKIGPHTARLFERMMADKPHPEMGYRGCLGLIRQACNYSHTRMESAAELALLTGACRYRSIESILKNSLAQQPLPSSAPPAVPPPPRHDNIRGAEYFE